MSILITDLEMPTERESFNLTIKYNGTVLDTETGMQVAEAHELPPHGRLGDLDALIKRLESEKTAAKQIDNYDYWYALSVAVDFALAAPTIIPASKEADG